MHRQMAQQKRLPGTEVEESTYLSTIGTSIQQAVPMRKLSTNYKAEAMVNLPLVKSCHLFRCFVSIAGTA